MPLPRPDRRADLLAAAATCFARRGVAATAVDDLVRVAGVTPVILYRHFGSKNGLVHALVEAWAQERLAHGAQALDRAHAGDALDAMLDLLIDARPIAWPRLRDEARLTLAIIDAAARDRALATRVRMADAALLDQLTRAIARAQGEGVLDRSLDAAATAELLTALGDGLLVRAALSRRTDAPTIATLQQAFRALADRALGRLRAPDATLP
ncbi:MAG: TetR/AcrR family transcriptional regulator [Gemmatimonadaceae bacterium]|jgi:AcrR family transcriptional regulator|nr:TetR/AcrR family transcriptional regulator [Gemmatimonadaceae bacterium]